MNQIILPNIANSAEQQRLIAAGQGIVRLTRLGGEIKHGFPTPPKKREGLYMVAKKVVI